MLCKNCNENEVTKYSKYSNGDFCSRECARSFSTKEKRKEINDKVSNSLTGRGHGKIKIICKNCSNEFERTWNKRNEKFCSKSCSISYRNNLPENLKKMSLNQIKRVINGEVRNSGIKMIYDFNGNQIRCDSKIEYSCLDYFVKSGATKIDRCDFFIKYFDGEKVRRYNPDFKIKIDSTIYIVEAKSYMSVKTINDKWRKYNELSVLKKKELDNYCRNNNFISFWFTSGMNRKFYDSICID